jgi:ADP-ribose pyrophosphatase YjhB (NUDIX family)
MTTRPEIAALEAAIGDPSKGLPDDVFKFVSRLTPLINVDLLIQDDDQRTLLTWRDDEFYGPGWHVPGGIIRYKETSAERIRACAREELGADVEFAEAPIFIMEAIGPEATRGHHISLLFRCRLRSAPDESRRAQDGTPHNGQWGWHDGCPPDLLEEQQADARFMTRSA